MIKNKDITLEEFINKIWFPIEVDNGEKKVSTISFNHSMAQYVIKYFKNIKINAITTMDLKLCLKYYRSGYQKRTGEIGMEPKTMRSIYSTLKMIFRSAYELEYIPKNPMDFVPSPKVPKKEVNALSESELKVFMDALSNTSEENSCMLRLFVTTGIRRGECAGLRWDDIDLENNQLHIRRNVTRATGRGVIVGTPKTQESNRDIPFSSNTSKALVEHKQNQHLKFPDKDLQFAYVFPNKDNPYIPCEPTSITRKVKSFLTKNGLPSHSPHDLRHTFASLICDNSDDTKSLQNLLGHSDFATTFNLYVARRNMDQMRNASTKFTDKFGL